MKINDLINEAIKQRLDAKCWKGKHKEGTKIKGGVRVNNCVPNESINEYGDTAKGQKMLTKVQKRAVDRVVSKKADTDPKYAKKNQDTANAAYDRMSDKDLEEGEHRMSRAAKGHEKYGKAGMAALAKAGRDGAGEEKLDKIRDQHDKYDEGIDELSRVLELSGLNLTADEQFDIIEEMVESLAFEHGVDAEVIWEDFELVDDRELLESAAWKRKEGKSKAGGLNAKGVASYRRENPGSKLQTAVTTKPSKLKPGSKAAKRRKSFCARMGGNKGPMKKPNGDPTRKALALRKWNC
jgi:hypothetical protein